MKRLVLIFFTYCPNFPCPLVHPVPNLTKNLVDKFPNKCHCVVMPTLVWFSNAVRNIHTYDFKLKYIWQSSNLERY